MRFPPKRPPNAPQFFIGVCFLYVIQIYPCYPFRSFWKYVRTHRMLFEYCYDPISLAHISFQYQFQVEGQHECVSKHVLVLKEAQHVHIQEGDDIRILFDRTRFSEVRHHWTLVLALFYTSA